jgi:hypothetical protein
VVRGGVARPGPLSHVSLAAGWSVGEVDAHSIVCACDVRAVMGGLSERPQGISRATHPGLTLLLRRFGLIPQQELQCAGKPNCPGRFTVRATFGDLHSQPTVVETTPAQNALEFTYIPDSL